MLTLESRIEIDPSPFSAEVDGEVVMMDAESGQYYALDPIGSAIWRRLATPLTVQDLCVELEAEYDAAPEVIRADVLALLDQMAERGLIRTVL